MGWFKNVTTVRKWGFTTKNYFFGVYEEITESTSNYTSNATAYIKNLDNVKSIKDFDSVQVKGFSKKVFAAGSALICSQSFRKKAFNIISGASANRLV